MSPGRPVLPGQTSLLRERLDTGRGRGLGRRTRGGGRGWPAGRSAAPSALGLLGAWPPASLGQAGFSPGLEDDSGHPSVPEPSPPPLS